MPIEKVDKIWMNGEFIDWDKAQIHVLTHCLHYGSGVFEGIRCYNAKKGPAVFRLKEHIHRLFNSAKIYFMDLPYTESEICQAIKETIRINKIKECYIRPIAYVGYGEVGLNPLKNPIDVAIAVWPWGTYLGEEGLKNGIRTKTSSFTRIDNNCLPPTAKACGQYLNSILAKLEALKGGYDEAIVLESRGMVSEGPGENLFMIKDGVLKTPPLAAGVLDGITRDSVIKVAKDEGILVEEVDISRGMLYVADELFFTGTAAELTPIREVDDREIGKPGPITKKLQYTFFKLVKGEVAKYTDWLDYI